MNGIRLCLHWTLGLCVLVFTGASPPRPTWPDQYKSCVQVTTSDEIIRAGWYVDVENRRMRLDRYGIPAGFNQSTVELFQYYVSHVEDFDYACSQFGPPIYEFIYLYDQLKALTLVPHTEPPYRKCSVSSIFNKFPNSPLFPDIEFVDEGSDNITHYDHWRSEFFLFTIDYLFHSSNGLPYKLILNEEVNTFLSFQEGKLDQNTFFPPPAVVCQNSANT